RPLRLGDERGESLNLYWSEPLHSDVVAGERHGSGCKDHRTGLGELLHAAGKVGGLADGGVVHAKVAAKSPDHDFPGIQSHSDLYDRGVGLADALRISPDVVLHSERRIARPHAVILMGEWRPEERHDPIAH